MILPPSPAFPCPSPMHEVIAPGCQAAASAFSSFFVIPLLFVFFKPGYTNLSSRGFPHWWLAWAPAGPFGRRPTTPSPASRFLNGEKCFVLSHVLPPSLPLPAMEHLLRVDRSGFRFCFHLRPRSDLIYLGDEDNPGTLPMASSRECEHGMALIVLRRP